MPDVDIDFYDRDNTLKLFKHTPASMIKEGKAEKHKTGVYFHAVPEHPVTGHASLDSVSYTHLTLPTKRIV